MIFQIGRAAGKGIGNAMSGKGVDPKDVKPTEVGGAVVGLLVAGVVLIIVISLAHGGQVTSLITPIAVILGLLVLGGILAAACSGTQPQHRSLVNLQLPPTPYEETVRLREAVRERSCEPERPKVPSPAALTVEPVVAPAPPRTEPRHFPTFKQIIREDAENIRLMRVAAILVDECPSCTAKSSQFCTFHPGQLVHVLDRERSIVVHGSRIGNSLKAGHAKIEDVKAQFNGTIPDDVLRSAL